MAQPRRQTKTRFSIYWCTTPDGAEDWFVVAQSAEEACRYHELTEEYSPGEAAAERIASLPESLQGRRGYRDPVDDSWSVGPAWPSDSLLRACGAEVFELPAVLFEVPRKVVRVGGRVFRSAHVASIAPRLLLESDRPRLVLLQGGKAS